MSKEIALDGSGKGESPQVLYPVNSLSGYIWMNELASAYTRLSSIHIIVGYSPVTGMGQMMTQAKISETVPRYCINYFEQRLRFPVGLHRIKTGRCDSLSELIVKFPDHVPIICVRGCGSRQFVPGRAVLLDRDWYLNGNQVHRLSPDDPIEVILRSPLRSRNDALAVAIAICDASRCTGRLIPLSESIDVNELAEKIWITAENLLKDCGYPVNLAELYRHLESPTVGKHDAEVHAEKVADCIGRFVGSVIRLQSNPLDEASRVTAHLHPAIQDRTKKARLG